MDLEYYDEDGYKLDGGRLAAEVIFKDGEARFGNISSMDSKITILAGGKIRKQFMTKMWLDWEAGIGETADEYMARKGYASWGLRLRSD